MSLLPRSAEEFSSAEYWERFFKKRGEKSFEWYGDYNKLCGVLHKYIKLQDKVNGLFHMLSIPNRWVTKSIIHYDCMFFLTGAGRRLW